MLGLALAASCVALAGCAYEQVLPLKELPDAQVADVGFADLGVDTSGDVAAPDLSDTGTSPGPDSAPGTTSAADTTTTLDTAVDSDPDVPDSTADTLADTVHAPDTAEPERCGGDLFLSEYVEGTSWNKAIEVANFTGRDVDLQGYALWKITNGGDWAEGAARPFRLTGVLAHGAVLVVCHGSAAAPILAACDVATTVDFAEFNGDDALALARNGAIIDVIGSDGADPGVGWAVAGVTEATEDHTLRRKVDVVEGSERWSESAPTWDVLGNDVIGGPGGLGELAVTARCEVTAPPRAALNEIAAAGQAGDGQDFVEIAAFSGVGQQVALDVGGWVIASTSGRYSFPPGTTVPPGGFRAVSQDMLGFGLGLVDRVWLYDTSGALQDVVGWRAEDLAADASYGRLPDLTGALIGNSIATPGAANRDPEVWCGDAICQDDEDCRACPQDCPVCWPGPGDLVVSEVMADPASGPEWFEVVNIADVPLELSQVVVRDEALDLHVIAADGSRVIQAGAFLVLASGPLPGVADPYVFSGISLSSGVDQIIVERHGVVIDAISWTGSPGKGIAWSLTAASLTQGAAAAANDLASAWCAATDAFGAGQLASPGAANPVCAECGDKVCSHPETCDACASDCGACLIEACALDLFISQYVEGTSYNKALEIANRTGLPVDLSHYALWRIMNGGSGWADLTASSRVALSGTLAHGEVWVGCNTSSDEALEVLCDASFGQGSAPTNFNGDDAVALAKDGVLIDVIGLEAVDPGLGWGVGDVTEATANHTLVRKPSIRSGNVDWAASAAAEWIVRAEDDFAGLGSHDVDYTCEP